MAKSNGNKTTTDSKEVFVSNVLQDLGKIMLSMKQFDLGW